MPISQNGWLAATTYTGHGIPLSSLRWVTGTVRSGDVHTVLDYLGERFHAEVEPIVKAHSWGFAPRQIRGKSVTLSNHASGTAVDFNAPNHGLGLSGTFTPAKVRAIERILADLEGVVRWGGHYTARKDEMHFEINCGPDKLARIAAKIRKGQAGTRPAPAPTPTTPDAPTPIPEDDDMATHYAFVADRASGGESWYIQNARTGTYTYLPDLGRKAVYERVRKESFPGDEVKDWSERKGGSGDKVGDPWAFGEYVGPDTFRPKGA